MGGQGPTFGRILVAFDGSPSAQDALALAQRLRDADGGELLLACVIPGLPRHIGPTGDARADAAEMLAETRAGLPRGVPARLCTPVAASAARGLTELAEAEGADLIAIGSEHGGSDARIGLTRTAGKLLHGAPCAVAVAPPGLRETGPFRHVGVALDASPEASAALDTAYALAGRDGSAITLYSALDDISAPLANDDSGPRLAAQTVLDASADQAPAGVNPRTVLLHGAAGRVIANASDGVIDLLVTGSRSYGPLQRALLGSVSEVLIARATHPVVVVPRQAARPAPVAAA